MSKNINRIIEPIDWQEIVKEAKIRRKREGLTQKAHAKLAGVSIPTMISFDNAETTLSIQKTLDILDVVGMVKKRSYSTDILKEFALSAQDKWKMLIKSLPTNSLAAHPFGYYAYIFYIEGSVKEVNIQEFRKILEEISNIKYSGWSPFWISRSNDIAPYLNDDNNVECWIGNKYLTRKSEEISPTPADYWRASSSGLMYLQRAYDEDCRLEALKPGTVFDLSLPISTLAEVICYADRLRRKISKDITKSSVMLRILYTGLKSRKLVNWTDPACPIFEDTTSSITDELEINTKFSLSASPYDYEDHKEFARIATVEISKIVSTSLNNLYSKFNFFQLQDEFILQKVAQTLSRTF